mgnify:CR=1 FL=1
MSFFAANFQNFELKMHIAEIEKPNSSHYLLSGVTMGGVFM